MRSKHLAPLGGAVVALLMASAAWADADGWYVAADAGWHMDYSTQAESEFVKPNGITAKWRYRTEDAFAAFARLGYRFNPNRRAALEGGYRHDPMEYIHGNGPVQQGDPSPNPVDYGQPIALCAPSSPANTCVGPDGYANNWT